jgi:HD-like signal output (HDOD) protein
VKERTEHPAEGPVAAVAAEPENPEALRERVQRVGKLPPMPGIASQIIRLRANPFANASELAAIIEQDPSLSAQLLRYASSPFYAYQGKVERVEQAIVRVLGMDFVMEFAFGLALGRPFSNPKEGPLGLDAFWNHAVHSASLAQTLCNAMEYSRRPHAGLAYLAGLLHNFGFLLLGHMFRPQFERLNTALMQQPDRPILELEREVLGVTHTELGLWLMEAWDMPREIIEAVREHHNPQYHSDYSEYANLVCLSNQLLRRLGIGDAETMDISPSLLDALGLNEVQAEAALGTVLGGRENLEFIARKMAA